MKLPTPTNVQFQRCDIDDRVCTIRCSWNYTQVLKDKLIDDKSSNRIGVEIKWTNETTKITRNLIIDNIKRREKCQSNNKQPQNKFETNFSFDQIKRESSYKIIVRLRFIDDSNKLESSNYSRESRITIPPKTVTPTITESHWHNESKQDEKQQQQQQTKTQYSSNLHNIPQQSVINPLVGMIGIANFQNNVDSLGHVSILIDYQNMINVFRNEFKYKILTDHDNDDGNTGKYKIQWTKKEIMSFTNKIRTECQSGDHDGLVFIISCHSTNGNMILDSNGKIVCLKTIFEYFNENNCPYLVDKPKIFIIDCGGTYPLETQENTTIKDVRCSFFESCCHCDNNFCFIFANSDQNSDRNTGIKYTKNGGLLIRNVAKVLNEKKFIENDDLDHIIKQIKTETKLSATERYITAIVENRSTIEANVFFKSNNLVSSLTDESEGITKESPVNHHPSQARVSCIDDLPKWLRDGFKNIEITKLNEMQSNALKTLTIGKNNEIISPSGTGKTTLACINSLYHLYVKKGTVNVVIVAANTLHVIECYRQLRKMCVSAPDYHDHDELQIHLLQAGRSLPCESTFKNGKNIFVSDCQRLLSLLNQSTKSLHNLTDNLTNISFLDCDTLLIKPCVEFFSQIFCLISADNIGVNLFSNSWNTHIEEVAKMTTASVHVYNYESKKNIIHWFVPGEDRRRKDILTSLCVQNPFDKGIIFSNENSEAVEVINILRAREDISAKAILANDLPKQVFDVIDDFKNGRIDYLCVTDESPHFVLSKVYANVVINYKLAQADMYSKRAHCTGTVNVDPAAHVHVISIVAPTETDVFESVETICDITIDELPDSMQQALCPRQQTPRRRLEPR